MIIEESTCQRGLFWGWVLLLFHSSDAEPHDLYALDSPWKYQVKTVGGVFRVFSDPKGS